MASETAGGRLGPAANSCDRRPCEAGREHDKINRLMGSDSLVTSSRNPGCSLIDLEEAARAAVSLRLGHILSDEEWRWLRLRLMEFAGVVRSWRPAKSVPASLDRNNPMGVGQRAQVGAAPEERFQASIVSPSRKAA
jgi:hypothetical protein